MISLFVFLACASKDATPVDTGSGGNTNCIDPTAEITAPAEGTVFLMGDDVTLTATAVSSKTDDLSGLELLWAIEDDVLADHGADAHWIANIAGEVLIRFQITDECGVAQDDVTVMVNE